MSVVSWGAPTLKFVPIEGNTPPQESAWTGGDVITIPGDDLLQNSSQLNTSAGEEKTLKNEKGVDVDKKVMPSSFTFTTSIIKKTGYTPKFPAVNGVVNQNYAMRLYPEDKSTVGFQFLACTVAVAAAWNAEQGATDVLTVNGIQSSDLSKSVCEDFTPGA